MNKFEYRKFLYKTSKKMIFLKNNIKNIEIYIYND